MCVIIIIIIICESFTLAEADGYHWSFSDKNLLKSPGLYSVFWPILAIL